MGTTDTAIDPTFASFFAYALCFLYVPIAAVLNRIRGGGYLPESIGTAKKMFMVAVAIAIMTAILAPPNIALAVGLSFILWDVMLPWGRWYTLNRFPRNPSGKPRFPLSMTVKVEDLIESISDYGGKRRDRVAFFIRNSLAFTGGATIWLVMTGSYWGFPIAIAAALLQGLAYDLGWILAGKRPEYGINNAEHITGALWGLAIGFGILAIPS